MNQNGKLRFAALRRVSTEQQEKIGESLRTQKAEIEEVTADLGTIVEWYGGTEHATPGHEKKELERLLSDAQIQPCKFDAVIVAHADRWSRDNSVSRAGLELFREHRIRFFAGSIDYDLFNPDSELYLGISAVVGQFHARNQMLKSLKNRINRAERGVPTGGKEPYGRAFIRSKDRQGGHWEVDAKKHELVKDCAKRYLAGEAIKDLANEYCVNASNLWKVLTKVSGSKWQLKFNSKVLNLHRVVEMSVPALLDDKTIQAIHAKAEANRTYTHGHIKHHYLFSRMIQCEHCGYAMIGQTNHNKLRYYRHAHSQRDRPCNGAKTKSWIPADGIEDIVMRHLFETFGNPSSVQQAIEEATPNSARIQDALKRRERIEKELAKAESSRRRVIDLVVKDTISEADASESLLKLKERQVRLEKERLQLEDELAHVPCRQAIAIHSKQVAAKFSDYTNARVAAKSRYANNAFAEMSYAEKRQLCEMVFSGRTAEGKRMGVSITWDESGKTWKYRIEGHLIDESGPVKKDFFVFGAAHLQKALVTKTALHSRDTDLLSHRSSTRGREWCR